MSKFKFFIFSEDPDKLLKFYTDTLNYKIIKELKYPKDYGYMVEVAPGYEIWIARHSQVHGYNKDPFRHLLNLYSDDVMAVYNKVKDVQGVKIIQEPISMGEFVPGEARTVFTFLDPEGNCLQFMNPS